MSDVRRPRIKILYGGVDVSFPIEPYLVEAKLTSYLAGKADEIDFQVEDREGIFSGQYWPLKGDDVEAGVGWDQGAMTSAGSFTLDEAQVDGPPWTVRIRGLSRSNKKALVQKNSRGFDNTTLMAIAKQLGNDLQMMIDVQGHDLRLERVTQHRETDLQFLHRVAWKYGFVTKIISPDKITLVPLADLLGRGAEVLIEPTDVIHLSLRSKTSDAPRSAVVRYFDPVNKAFLGQLTAKSVTPTTFTSPIPDAPTIVRTFLPEHRGEESVLKIMERVESLAQADLRSETALLHTQIGQVEGNVTLPWHPELTAGMNIYLGGFGRVDGAYIINRCEHSAAYGGYQTEVDIAANPRSHAKPSKVKKINTGKGHK